MSTRLNFNFIILLCLMLSLSACNNSKKKVETGSKNPAGSTKVEDKSKGAVGGDTDDENKEEDLSEDKDKDTDDSGSDGSSGKTGIAGLLPKILPLIKSIMSGGMPDMGSIMSIFADLIGGGGGLSGGGLDE